MKMQLRFLVSVALVMVGVALIGGCVSPDIDRSQINDVSMDTAAEGLSSDLSPLTGLKSRSKVNGGNSCSVCAH